MLRDRLQRARDWLATARQLMEEEITHADLDRLQECHDAGMELGIDFVELAAIDNKLRSMQWDQRAHYLYFNIYQMHLQNQQAPVEPASRPDFLTMDALEAILSEAEGLVVHPELFSYLTNVLQQGRAWEKVSRRLARRVLAARDRPTQITFAPAAPYRRMPSASSVR